jgi:AraC family transcriptional regulator
MMKVSHRTAVRQTPPRSPDQRQFVLAGSWRVELLPRAPYQASYTPDEPTIGFAFESQAGVHAFEGCRKTDFRAKPNSLAYVPAGCDIYSESEHGGEYLKITLTREWNDTRLCARRFNDVIDHIAIVTAQTMRQMLLTSDCSDALQYDYLISVLKERTACALDGIKIQPATNSWMTPRRLRLIDELIEARLHNKLTVQELADALRLSTGFFSRAFKAAVGKAPHDYIIDRRLSRARALLQHTQQDLTDIAHASGFSSHAHMTATFCNRLGLNPRKLRDGYAPVLAPDRL